MQKQELSSDYYYNLTEYKPMCCYRGKGVPLFLIHKSYLQPLKCLLFLDIIHIASIVFFYMTPETSNNKEYKYPVININILAFILNNIFYVLTVFLNPGIISEMDLQKQNNNIKYCQKCKRKTLEMTHCNDCNVCVSELDHHCGFFGKCIAGIQRFAFYTLMLVMFCTFLCLLSGLSLNMSN